MQSITQEIQHPAITDTAGIGNHGNRLVSTLRGAMAAIMARRQTRRVVQSLSDAQLRDSGIDRADVLGNRPVIDVDARLATYLASLR